jgi:hypothetical protein
VLGGERGQPAEVPIHDGLPLGDGVVEERDGLARDRVVERLRLEAADVGVFDVAQHIAWTHGASMSSLPRLTVAEFRRLDALIELANSMGASTTRTEFVGVLLLHASEDGEELLEKILSYRRATAAQARMKATPGRNVLEFKRHRRGPRPRTANTG